MREARLASNVPGFGDSPPFVSCAEIAVRSIQSRPWAKESGRRPRTLRYSSRSRSSDPSLNDADAALLDKSKIGRRSYREELGWMAIATLNDAQRQAVPWNHAENEAEKKKESQPVALFEAMGTVRAVRAARPKRPN